MSSRSFLVCLLSAGAVASYAQSGSTQVKTPEQWLDAMHDAFHEVGYEGVFVYRGGSDSVTMKIVHLNVDGVTRIRLVHLNGAPGEVIRHGDHVVRMVLPSDETFSVAVPAGPWGHSVAQGFRAAEKHYRIRIDGEDRIAGRRAVQIMVSPWDEDRFGHRLWLDHDTALLLRSELHDARGDNLEEFQFASLVIGDNIPESALEPDPGEGWVHDPLTAESDAGRGPSESIRWHAGWVPDGFVMADAEVRDVRGSGQDVTAMMWSDGLAAFHVFVESIAGGDASDLVSRDGATVVVTHVLEPPQMDQHLVTVVGELPTPTARRIARSVYYQN